MKSSSTTARWPLGMAVLATFVGCGGGEVDNTLPTAPEPTVVQKAGSRSIGEYVLEIKPSERKLTMHKLSAAALAAEARTPGLTPQALIDAVLTQDGVTGSNGGSTTNSTVELVTTSVNDTYMAAASGGCAANSFCANVTLNSFWTTALNFTYTQVTAIVDSTGAVLSGHSGSNSDTAPASTGPLANNLGLWRYQTAAIDTTHFSGGSTGVVLPGVSNGATRLWQFANPDDANIYVRLRVMGSTAPTNYTFGSRTASFSYACTLGAGESQLNMTNAVTNVTPIPQNQPIAQNAPFFVLSPFAFNFFGTSYPANTQVNFSKWGQVTFGATFSGAANMPSNTTTMTQAVADGNTGLPGTASPRPAVFVWWDTLRYGGSPQGMCAKVSGSAPNRQLHLSVSGAGFSGSGPYATFSTTINESTDEIWLNYSSQTAGTAPPWTATVGAQNTAGTTSVPGSSGAFLTTFPANTTKVLLPTP